jgi:hypothetical protein
MGWRAHKCRIFDDLAADDYDFACPLGIQIVEPEPETPPPRTPNDSDRAMEHCEYAFRAPSCSFWALCMRPGPHTIKIPIEDCNPRCSHRTPRRANPLTED